MPARSARVVTALAMRTTAHGSRIAWPSGRAALYEDTAVELSFYIDTSPIRSGHAATPVTISFIRAQAIAWSRVAAAPSNGRFDRANHAATPG